LIFTVRIDWNFNPYSQQFPPDGGFHYTRNACGSWRIASWTTWHLL
jgi:hypothetical protein